MSIRSKLIELYIEHPTSEIEQGEGSIILEKFNVTDYTKLIALDNYMESYQLVSLCAHRVDDLKESAISTNALVRDSLREQRNMIDNGEPNRRIDVVAALIKGRFYDKEWDDEQRRDYDEKSELLEWRDFFISYTNRDAPSLNQEFRSLIKSTFGKYPKPDETNNFVSRVIYRHLRRYQQLLGFFDNEELKVGEDIELEVDKYCHKAFAIIQLVEPLVFEREPPKNWCYYEYQAFNSSPQIKQLFGIDKDRHFFILINDDLDNIIPEGSKMTYGEWYSRMKRLKRVSINGIRNPALRTKSREIAQEIIKLRNEIVDKWLNS